MRLEITRKSDLALRALRLLSQSGPLKGRQLADGIGTTPQFIAQVMAPLVRREWVRSEYGPTGGYALEVDLDTLSVLDVIETIEGVTADGRCVLRGSPCPPLEPCALHAAWLRARSALLGQLKATSVADLEEDRSAP